MTQSHINERAHPPCPAPFNLAEYVLRAGQETPDKIALAVVSLSGAERWSYAKLRAAVLGTATGLLDQGLRPGDRVLMRLGNSVEFPLTYLAAISVGMIPVPTSAMLTAPEVEKIISEVAPRLIVAADGVAVPQDSPCPMINEGGLREMATLKPAQFDFGDPERPAYIIYTSGTSGTPRAVTHAHRAIWARQMMFEDWYGLSHQDRLMHAGAFNWTYTLGTGLMDPWTVGATALIPAEGITSAQLPLLMKRHDATLFAAAPGVYRQLLRAPMPTLPKLRHGLSAGEKLAEVTRNAWQDATGTPIYEAYGMSECSTFISGAPRRPAPPGTLGHPQDGRQVSVCDEEGRAGAKTGIIGVHRSEPGLMLGYWSKDLNGPAPFLGGNWFMTGDCASVTEDGAIRYEGRSDDMMNAGGFRVSPLEVEAAMTTHPEVQECAAVEQRVRNDTSIIALYYTSADEIDEATLKTHAEECLARYKAPRSFHRIKALPKNPNGKLLRRALRDPVIAKR